MSFDVILGLVFEYTLYVSIALMCISALALGVASDRGARVIGRVFNIGLIAFLVWTVAVVACIAIAAIVA